MQGLILAAGRGRRLTGDSHGLPKCLVKIGGTTLLEYQIAMFRRFGICDVCVVVGYRADWVIPYIERMGCAWRINNRFAETNSLYSLSLALYWLRTDFFLCNCDVLADPGIYRSLVQSEGDALAFDSSSGHDPEHMKVRLGADGALKQIGKKLRSSVCGENVGLLKLSESSVPRLHGEVESALENGGENQWAPAAIDRLAQTRRIVGVDIHGLPWAEIDFPEDLDDARARVWPQICRGNGFDSTVNKRKTTSMI